MKDINKAKSNGSLRQWWFGIGLRLNLLLYNDELWHEAEFEIELGNVSLAYGFADKAHVHYNRALQAYHNLEALSGRYFPRSLRNKQQLVASKLAAAEERMRRINKFKASI